MPLKPQDTPKPPVITLDARGVGELAHACIQRDTDPNRRVILAIAGIPGSGKSTLATRIVDRLNQDSPGSAMVFAMDGFHLPNDTLDKLGLRNRKGAPPTFDGQGYIKLLSQLRDATRSTAVPVFDRELDEPVYTGRPEHAASAATRYIVTEGNYLLLESMPWNAIGPLVDLSVFIDTPVAQARAWVIKRHIQFDRTPQQAKYWYETNDELNARHILDHSLHADRIARWP